MDVAVAQGRTLLDQAYEDIDGPRGADDGMDRLVVGLKSLRQRASPRSGRVWLWQWLQYRSGPPA